MTIIDTIFGKPKPRKKKIRKRKLDFEEEEEILQNGSGEPVTMDTFIKKKPKKEVEPNFEDNENVDFGDDKETVDEEELKEIKRVMKPKKPVIIKPKGKMFISINKANRVSLVISTIVMAMSVFLFIGSFTSGASGGGLIMIIFAILNMYTVIKYMMYRLQVEVVEDEIFE